MEKQYKLNEDQDRYKVAVTTDKEREIQKNFLSLLPGQYWNAFRQACAEAHQMYLGKSKNSVADTRAETKKMLQKVKALKKQIVEASPLTSHHLPPNLLMLTNEMLEGLAESVFMAKQMPNTKPTKSHRDVLAFKLVGLMYSAGMEPKVVRHPSLTGRGSAYYELMEMALKMVEGKAPSNMLKHMERGKKLWLDSHSKKSNQ